MSLRNGSQEWGRAKIAGRAVFGLQAITTDGQQGQDETTGHRGQTLLYL